MTDVPMVGAGPTGLTLACDLARRDSAVRIVDTSRDFPRSSRAKGPNPRSLEVLEDLGVVDEVLAAGSTPPPMRKYRGEVAIADADPFEGSGPTPDAPTTTWRRSRAPRTTEPSRITWAVRHWGDRGACPGE